MKSRVLLPLLAALFPVSAAAAEPSCKNPVLFSEEIAIGNGKLIDADDATLITTRPSRAQAWATFMPELWSVPGTYAGDPLPIGGRVAQLTGEGRGPRHLFVCIDLEGYRGMAPAPGNVLFPLFGTMPEGDHFLAAELSEDGAHVRILRGPGQGRKWLLVREVVGGDVFDVEDVRVRLVRILPDLGGGWIELAKFTPPRSASGR